MLVTSKRRDFHQYGPPHSRRGFLKAAAAWTLGAAAASAAEPRALEFWDSHGHLNSQFPEEWVETLAERMRAENVTRSSLTGVGLLSDHEDTDVLRAYEKHPRLFLPFLCNFDPNDSKSIAYVRHQLKTARGAAWESCTWTRATP